MVKFNLMRSRKRRTPVVKTPEQRMWDEAPDNRINDAVRDLALAERYEDQCYRKIELMKRCYAEAQLRTHQRRRDVQSITEKVLGDERSRLRARDLGHYQG